VRNNCDALLWALHQPIEELQRPLADQRVVFFVRKHGVVLRSHFRKVDRRPLSLELGGLGAPLRRILGNALAASFTRNRRYASINLAKAKRCSLEGRAVSALLPRKEKPIVQSLSDRSVWPSCTHCPTWRVRVRGETTTRSTSTPSSMSNCPSCRLCTLGDSGAFSLTFTSSSQNWGDLRHANRCVMTL
jgi:hypothetical protein